jgi:hypothetical protein
VLGVEGDTVRRNVKGMPAIRGMCLTGVRGPGTKGGEANNIRSRGSRRRSIPLMMPLAGRGRSQ